MFNWTKEVSKFVPLDVSHHMEIIGYDGTNYFKTRSGQILEIVELQGIKGLRHYTDEEINQVILGFSSGLRTLTKGVTIACLSAEVNFDTQIQYYEHRLNNIVVDEIQKAWLQYRIKCLRENIFYEERFYGLLFADDIQEMEDVKSNFYHIPYLRVKELWMNEKVDVLYRLHNLNAQFQFNRDEVIIK